jgi:hypothetical protein
MPLAALSFRKPQNSIQFTDVSVKMLQTPCGLQVIVRKYGKHHAMH